MSNAYSTGETIRKHDVVRIGKGKVDYSVTLPVDPSDFASVEIENLSTGRHKVIPAARLTLVSPATDADAEVSDAEARDYVSVVAEDIASDTDSESDTPVAEIPGLPGITTADAHRIAVHWSGLSAEEKAAKLAEHAPRPTHGPRMVVEHHGPNRRQRRAAARTDRRKGRAKFRAARSRGFLLDF